MMKRKVGELVLNKINKVVYEYVCYREDIDKIVVSSIHNNSILSETFNCGYYEIDTCDAIFGLDNIIDYFVKYVKKLKTNNKKKQREIDKPLDKGLGISMKNTLNTDIYKIKKKILCESLTIEEERALTKELNKKENELHTIELRLDKDLFETIAKNDIDTNCRLIDRYNAIIKELKRIAKETKNIVLEDEIENSVVIELEKVICNDNVDYKIIDNDENSVNDIDEVANIVNYNGNPIAVITFTSIVDNGDYDYDDNYVPYYEEEYSYRQVFYSPITGKKFVFKVSKTTNITNEYNEVSTIINKYCRRKRMKSNEKIEYRDACEKMKYFSNGIIEKIDYLD